MGIPSEPIGPLVFGSGAWPDRRALPPRPDVGTVGLPPVAPAPPPPRPSRRLIAVGVVAAILVALLTPTVLRSIEAADRRDEYRFLAVVAGEPLRWNPCEPIRYVVNLGPAPPGSLRDVQDAVLRVAGITGITFDYEGLTDEVATPDRDPVQPARYGERWAPILIAWVDPRTSTFDFEPDGHDAAAIASPFAAPGSDVLVSGVIVLNAIDPNPPGFSAPGDQGPVLLHELAHILGLGHVKQQGELMEPYGGGVTDFGPGDLEGLDRLGRDGGCLTTPTPP
jgi:hypothetical protein